MVKRGLLFGGIITFLAFCFSFSAYADDSDTASTTFSIDVSAAALQVSATSDANITLDPASSNFFGSTDITVTVATNNATGYTMTMDVTTTDLTHSTIKGNNAPIIPTLVSPAPQSTFPSNAWGYKVTGDNYNPVLLSNANPAWVSENPTNGTDHTISLAAKVDGVKQAGTYENTLTFNVVANSLIPHDNVSFNGNGADSGDMSGDAFSVTSGDSTLLPSNKFTKSGYRFIGWNTSINGTGYSYADEGEYNAISTVYNQNVTLYAMWSNLPEGVSTEGTTPSGNPGITISRAYEIAYAAAHKGMWEKDETGNGYTQVTDGIYHNRDVRWDMQGMTPEICDSVTAIHDVYGALDTRDWHIYNITKTLDGRCWLQDNLALDPTDSATASRLKGRTNAPDDAIDQYLIGGTTPTPGYTRTAVYNAVGQEASSWNTPMIDNSEVNTVPSDSMSQDGNWKVGVYYNYCAATAGSYCYDRYTQYDKPGTAIDAEYDVCPTGWRLPTGNPDRSSGGEVDGNDWKNFVYAYKDEKNLQRSVLHLAYSGTHSYWGSIQGVGTEGYWWASTYYYRPNDPNTEMTAVQNRTDAYELQWGTFSARCYMYSVRCIAK